MPTRVAFTTNFVSPYRLGLFSALASTRDWQFKLFSSCETEFDRQWKPPGELPFDHQRSFSLSYIRRVKHQGRVGFLEKRQVHVPLGLVIDLCRFHPDAIISTEFGAGTLISAVYACILRRRLVIWFYGTPHSERDVSWKQRLLRKILISMADAFVGMGIEARQYLLSLGLPSKAIFDAPNTTGLVQFQIKLPEQERIAIRRRLGMTGLSFLYVGHINQLKGLAGLLTAWQTFSAQPGVEVSLTVVGDGPDRAQLGSRVQGNVKFLGYIDPEKMHTVFQAADVFVFPTLQDVWGLVVNEALMSGLPVICSRYAGCAPDVIIEGKNGWIVDPVDQDDFSRTLMKAWEARGRKAEMSRAARETAAGLTISRMASGFNQAIAFALSKQPSTFKSVRFANRVNVDPS